MGRPPARRLYNFPIMQDKYNHLEVERAAQADWAGRDVYRICGATRVSCWPSAKGRPLRCGHGCGRPPHRHETLAGVALSGRCPPALASGIVVLGAMSTRSIGLDGTLYDYLLTVSVREPPVLADLRAETAR